MVVAMAWGGGVSGIGRYRKMRGRDSLESREAPEVRLTSKLVFTSP